MKKVEYDAFISYRHCPVDQYVAEVLHKELETFRLPRNLVKQRKKQEKDKTRINRVFRDKDELPIASDLSDPIMAALEESNYLIVICSPRLRESIWCQKEIETFLKIHGRDRILAVLAEGEPIDSFPDILRFQEIEVVLENGEIGTERKEVEPLAADVRGESKKKIKKKIKEEVVRLAAPMFDCAYDELKQRHREQRIKKIVTGSLIGAAICFVFGAVSSTMALRIHKQSIEITEQASIIEERYEEAMVQNALASATTAQYLLESGDRIAALQMAYEALPMSQDSSETIPYTAQAQYALTSASYLYQMGGDLLPSIMLHHDSNVSMFLFSPGGDLLVTIQEYGQVVVWDTITKEEIGEFTIQSSQVSMAESTMVFLDNQRIFYPTTSGFAIYHIEQGTTIYEHESIKPYEVKLNQSGTLLYIKCYDGYYVWDAITYEQLDFVAQNSIATNYDVYFAYDDTTLLVVTEHELSGLAVETYDYESQTISSIQEVNLSNFSRLQLVGEEGILLIANNYETAEGEIQPTTLGELMYLEGGVVQWTYHKEGDSCYEVSIAGANGEYIVVQGYSELTVIDIHTGEVLDTINYGQQIVWSCLLKGSECTMQVALRDGSYYALNIEYYYDNGTPIYLNTNAYNIKQFDVGLFYFAQLMYNSTGVVLYTYERNEDVEDVLQLENTLMNVSISDNGEFAIGTMQQTLEVYDVLNGRLLYEVEMDSFLTDAVFVGADCEYVAVLSSQMVTVIEAETGRQVSQFEVEVMSSDTYVFHQDSARLSIVTDEQVICYDVLTGTQVYQCDMSEALTDQNVVALDESERYVGVASKQENEIQIFEIEGELACTIEADVLLVRHMFFHESDAKLYVRYADNTVEVYRADTGEWIATYDGLEDTILGVNQKSDGVESVLYGYSNGYVVNESHELIERIPYYCSEIAGQYYLRKTTQIVTVPDYSYEELLQYAEKLL